MKFHIMAGMMLGAVVSVRAVSIPILSTVELKSTNSTSGLIEDVLLVDYATTSPDQIFSAATVSNRKDVVWSGDAPLRNPGDLSNDTEFTPYIAKTIKELDLFLELRTNDLPAMTVLGVRLYQTNDITRSLSVLDRVWHLDPYYERSAELYSAILIKAGDLARACRVIRKQLDYLPHNNIIRFNLACAYARNNENNAAINQLVTLARSEWYDFIFYLTDEDLDSIRGLAQFKEMESLLHTIIRERVFENITSTTFAPNL